MSRYHAPAHPAHMERCAHACHECQDLCLGLINHCLERGDDHARPEHINMLLDCIAICQASHNVLHRHSRMHASTCRACAEICFACGNDCERLGDDDRMLRCAQACYRCGELCEQMGG